MDLNLSDFPPAPASSMPNANPLTQYQQNREELLNLQRQLLMMILRLNIPQGTPDTANLTEILEKANYRSTVWPWVRMASTGETASTLAYSIYTTFWMTAILILVISFLVLAKRVIHSIVAQNRNENVTVAEHIWYLLVLPFRTSGLRYIYHHIRYQLYDIPVPPSRKRVFSTGGGSNSSNSSSHAGMQTTLHHMIEPMAWFWKGCKMAVRLMANLMGYRQRLSSLESSSTFQTQPQPPSPASSTRSVRSVSTLHSTNSRKKSIPKHGYSKKHSVAFPASPLVVDDLKTENVPLKTSGKRHSVPPHSSMIIEEPPVPMRENSAGSLEHALMETEKLPEVDRVEEETNLDVHGLVEDLREDLSHYNEIQAESTTFQRKSSLHNNEEDNSTTYEEDEFMIVKRKNSHDQEEPMQERMEIRRSSLKADVDLLTMSPPPSDSGSINDDQVLNDRQMTNKRSPEKIQRKLSIDRSIEASELSSSTPVIKPRKLSTEQAKTSEPVEQRRLSSKPNEVEARSDNTVETRKASCDQSIAIEARNFSSDQSISIVAGNQKSSGQSMAIEAAVLSPSVASGSSFFSQPIVLADSPSFREDSTAADQRRRMSDNHRDQYFNQSSSTFHQSYTRRSSGSLFINPSEAQGIYPRGKLEQVLPMPSSHSEEYISFRPEKPFDPVEQSQQLLMMDPPPGYERFFTRPPAAAEPARPVAPARRAKNIYHQVGGGERSLYEQPQPLTRSKLLRRLQGSGGNEALITASTSQYGQHRQRMPAVASSLAYNRGMAPSVFGSEDVDSRTPPPGFIRQPRMMEPEAFVSPPHGGSALEDFFEMRQQMFTQEQQQQQQQQILMHRRKLQQRQLAAKVYAPSAWSPANAVDNLQHNFHRHPPPRPSSPGVIGGSRRYSPPPPPLIRSHVTTEMKQSSSKDDQYYQHETYVEEWYQSAVQKQQW